MSAGKIALIVGGVAVVGYLAYNAFAAPAAVVNPYGAPVGAGGTLVTSSTTAAAPVGSPASGITLKQAGSFVAKVGVITAAAPVLGSVALVKGVGSAAKSVYSSVSNFL